MGGSCSCCCRGGEGHEQSKFEKGGNNDLSDGVVQNRKCTDLPCLPLFIAAQVLFVLVTIVGFQHGAPAKLYRPRDFRGAYCGMAENWNHGPDTASMPTLSYTMNVSNTVDAIMQQLICSSTAKKALVDGDGESGVDPILVGKAAEKYLCNCCLKPCGKCSGSLNKGKDLTTGSMVETIITGKMEELTDWAKGANLLSSVGNNGDTFSSETFWRNAAEHFNMVCLPNCDTSFKTAIDSGNVRTYTYTPFADDDLNEPWQAIVNSNSNDLTNELQSVIRESFIFAALPVSVCPYDPAHCVPMPGVQFTELGPGYCSLHLSSQVVDEVGDLASDAFESLGGTALSDNASESFGKFAGDFQQTLDTFFIVSILSFVFGLIFLVVLRYTVKICVWLAIILTVLLFAFGGALLLVFSGQCRGLTIFESSRQVVVAVFVKSKTSVKNLIDGRDAADESMDNDLQGTDYRGHQHKTRSGRVCLQWDIQDVMPEYNSSNYPSAGIEGNSFCRNPWNNESSYNARTIWCVTSDPEKPWEECTPIGIIRGACHDGYQVSSSQMRSVLFYASLAIWVLGLLWILIIMCLRKRIMLAIAVNQVAAVFVASNPGVIIIPVVQALCTIAWTAGWFFAASFLVSQVPDSWTPKGYFATYAEAYGTSSSCAFWEFSSDCAGKPGTCTGRWPSGIVWKDDVCEFDGDVAKCWRCAPPRYTMDLRFAASFFVFLWNSAFTVALGQMLVAMCVGMWFFTQNRGQSSVLKPAVRTVIRYHLGSVALGSLVVASVRGIRYVLAYFEKQANSQKNRVMACVLKCMQCFMWCFEKMIRFLNKNAYIQIALLGNGFCTSAKTAFFLILRNAARFGTLATLSGVIHCIGVGCIMSATLVGGYFLSREMHPDIEPFIPMICYGSVGMIIARLNMNVFGMAVDTSLQCFLAVEEMGVGGEFVPECLRTLVDKQS